MELKDLTNADIQYKEAAQKAIEDAFQTIENKCTDDGTNLTDNQEVKFRRTRLVSEVKPHKKSIHGKDFINYCEFLAGKRETCSKPKGIFNQILGLIRNNKPEFIIPSYRGIVESYSDLITQAAKIKPRIAKQMVEQNTNKIEQIEPEETNMQKKLGDKKTNKNTEKAAQKFENWLSENLKTSNLIAEKPMNKVYSGWVSYYLKHDRTLPSYWPNIAKEIMDKHYQDLIKFKPKKGKLISVSTEEPIIVTSATNPKFDIPSDTLSKFIMMAKNAGATEITIKL